MIVRFQENWNRTLGRVPSVRFMTAKEERDNENTLGWVEGKSIVLKQHGEVIKTIVHEVQHCLQDEDERSQGGNNKRYNKFMEFMETNPEEQLRGINNMFWNEHLEKLCKEWKECKQWMKEKVKWNFMLDNFGSTLYRHLIGEIEAREAEKNVGEIHMDMIHTAEEGITGLLKRKGWRTLAYYINNKHMFEEHKQEAKWKVEQYWKEENERRQQKQMEIQKQKEESYNYMEVLEDYYWNVLGDEYRAGMHKPRTNYKNKK